MEEKGKGAVYDAPTTRWEEMELCFEIPVFNYTWDDEVTRY